jgi:hypothetical protein
MNHSSYGNSVYITSSAKLDEPSNSRQGPLVFTCPATGLNVQRQLDDDQAVSESKNEAITCPAEPGCTLSTEDWQTARVEAKSVAAGRTGKRAQGLLRIPPSLDLRRSADWLLDTTRTSCSCG